MEKEQYNYEEEVKKWLKSKPKPEIRVGDAFQAVIPPFSPPKKKQESSPTPQKEEEKKKIPPPQKEQQIEVKNSKSDLMVQKSK